MCPNTFFQDAKIQYFFGFNRQDSQLIAQIKEKNGSWAVQKCRAEVNGR